MRVVHQFAPPMSAMIASVPGVTSADHMPLERRWDLPVDADVVFVLHGEGDNRDVGGIPRPAGWPGSEGTAQNAGIGATSVAEATTSNIGLLDRLLIHPHGDGYHVAHHLWPRIPHHQLPAFHREAVLSASAGLGVCAVAHQFLHFRR